MGALIRHSSSQVPGRLAGPRLFGDGGQKERPGSALALLLSRDSDKRGEVRSRTLTDCKLPWYDHRYRGRQGFSVPCAGREVSVGGRDVLCCVHSPRSALAGGFGTPGFAGEAGSTQLPSNVLSAVAFEGALVSRVGSTLPTGTVVPGGSVLVDDAGPSSHGGSIRDSCSGSAPVFRRILVGVGRTPPRSVCVRGVVEGGAVAAHQSSRNEGDFSGIAVISDGRWSSFDRDVRQLDSCSVQAGRDGFPLPLLVGQPASEVDRVSPHPPRCKVFTRAVQCSGRSPQPSGSGYRDGVVSPPAGGEVSPSSLGLTVDRSVRDEPQHEASPILFPCPGSPGSLRGHVSPSLGQPGCVCVSTLSSSRKGGGLSQRDPQSLHD